MTDPHLNQSHNPLDDRCPSRNPAEELDHRDEATAYSEALAMGTSLFVGKPSDKNWFFTYCSQLIWAHLAGAVTDEQFERLTNGQHPHTGDQLIKHRTETETSMAHVAAWDVTFRPGKSISVTALVGRDDRLVNVVRNANDAAMAALEKYVQQRMGGLNMPVTTGKWIMATFEHDTARPVDGYPAPLLHHHNLVMNMNAPDADAQMRALAPSAP